MARTARKLLRFNVLRVLCRANKQGGYAGMVEDWIAWNPGSPSFAELRERLLGFIEHYCGEHGIDPQFFLKAASFELGSVVTA